MRVYLAGTGGKDKTDWNVRLIEQLTVDYFDSHDLTLSNRNKVSVLKSFQNEGCDYYVCVITPKTEQYWTHIANIIEFVISHPNKAIICYDSLDMGVRFSQQQIQSILEICRTVSKYGGKVFTNLRDLAVYLNGISG